MNEPARERTLRKTSLVLWWLYAFPKLSSDSLLSPFLNFATIFHRQGLIEPHHKPHNQRCTLCSFGIREHYAFLTWVGLLWLRRHSAVHHSPILWRWLSLTVVEIRSKVVVVDRRCSHERLLTFIVILRLTIVIVIVVVVFDARWFCTVCEKKVWVHQIQPQETKACKNRGGGRKANANSNTERCEMWNVCWRRI